MIVCWPRESRQAGFTLIEMLVVLAILALTASIAMPLLGQPSAGLRLQTTATDLMGALRATRFASILQNVETVLRVDVERRTFESPAVRLRTLPSDMAARLKFASTEQAQQSEGGFRFFPDGSSTGGEITLMLGNREAKICVDWVTGQARLERC